MRPLCLALVLLATSTASAQPADALAARSSVSDIELAGGGLIVGATSWIVAARVVESAGAADGWAFLAYPVGIAAGVSGVSWARGADAPFGDAMLGASLGTLVGFGSAAALLYVTDANILSDGDAGVILAAAALALGAPVVGAVWSVSPATIRTPTGERVPSVSLQIGL